MPYSPTVSITTTPGISITMAGTISYEQFLNSLGVFVFRVLEMYVSTQTLNQLSEPIRYNIYDSNGNQAAESVIISADPYQQQKSILLDVIDKCIVLNGRSSLSFNIAAGENVMLNFLTMQASFEELEKSGKKESFFNSDMAGEIKMFSEFLKRRLQLNPMNKDYFKELNS